MTEPRTLADFGELTPAEQQVLAELDSGVETILGDGKLPAADAGSDRRIRPAFLRWCALGAGEGHRVHETGVRILGALIENDEAASRAGWKPHLDLEGCALDHDLGLFACRIAEPPLFLSASFQNLFLNGSLLPGLLADRLHAKGNVFLRKAETAGEVRLLGAELGGNLSLVGAKLSNATGVALHADGLRAKGGVFLREAETWGEVRLVGARLVGVLDCDGAKLSNSGGRALTVAGSNVTGAFFLRRKASIDGELILTAAQFGAINDDPSCWPEPGQLFLDRCLYGAFTGVGIDAASRICWLRLQNPAGYGQDFWPQPWEQCAGVLREMGHAEDARKVLIEKERLQRQDVRRRGAKWLRPFRWVLDGILGQAVRYGYRPLRAFIFLAVFWAVGFAVYSEAWIAREMKPNNAVVLRSAEWVGCGHRAPDPVRRANAEQSQLDCYLAQPEAGGYPEFSPFIYAADVLFPLVDIEQQALWVPDEDGPLGFIAKLVVYASILAGWALSLLAVAGFSGLVKSD